MTETPQVNPDMLGSSMEASVKLLKKIQDLQQQIEIIEIQQQQAQANLKLDTEIERARTELQESLATLNQLALLLAQNSNG